MVHFSKFAFILALAIAVCPSIIGAAPSSTSGGWIDDKVKEPKHFNAFPILPTTSSDSCQTQVVFEKDANDQKYNYNLFGVFENGKMWYLQPESPSDLLSTLAYVNATPAGQRGGEYWTQDNFVKVPQIVNLCDVGKDDPNFPAELRGQKPQWIRVQAVPNGISHPDQDVWYSNDFAVKNEYLTPQSNEIQNLWAQVEMQNRDPNHKNIIVAWSGPADPSDIQSYFVLVGPSHNAQRVQSFRFDEPKRTSVNIDIGYFTENVDVAVVILNKAGGMTAWSAVPQVHLKPARGS